MLGPLTTRVPVATLLLLSQARTVLVPAVDASGKESVVPTATAAPAARYAVSCVGDVCTHMALGPRLAVELAPNRELQGTEPTALPGVPATGMLTSTNACANVSTMPDKLSVNFALAAATAGAACATLHVRVKVNVAAVE